MTAPLHFPSGAPVAQNACATGTFALKGKPSGARRATAPLPVAQAQQAGVTHQQGECGTSDQSEKMNMGKSRYLVLQLDMAKHPRDIASRYHTGCGVLFPVSCDGYYDSEEGAKQVAEFLASEYPSMRTHVVQVVK